jgi:hypothetical protein
MEKTTNKMPEDRSAFWKNHIEAWKESGFSIADYCELEELAKSTFSYWKRKLEGKVSKSRFVEVKVPQQQPGGLIHIRLNRGRELGVAAGTDVRYVGELVKALEES